MCLIVLPKCMYVNHMYAFKESPFLHLRLKSYLIVKKQLGSVYD